MNRRDFLRLSNKGRSERRYVRYYQSTQTGLQPYTGPWTFDEAAHLLRRTMFGATRNHINYILTLNPASAVDQLLAPAAIPSPPVRDYGLLQMDSGMYDDPNVAQGQTWVNDFTRIDDGDLRAAVFESRTQSLRKWWMGVMLNQQMNIIEKMVLFWHHHFSVQKEEVNHPIMLFRHLNLLRQHAMGDVRLLTREVSIDAAMLLHLNGYLNSKVAPDENFARELQELFTVGKGDNSLYTESDVMEAARVLTGWRVNSDTLAVTIDASSHDTGTKQFSSFYNNTSIAGSADAAQELDALINMIFGAQECSLFICRKLYRWFVNSNIDSDAEINVIAPLAEIFRSNNFQVKPVLEALFKSEHFFDHANRACYIKSPIDFIVGSLREFNVPFQPYTNYATGYPMFMSLYNTSAIMGMDLLQPPDVNGWPAYHQDPMFYELWVNSNSLPQRADFTDALVLDNIIDVHGFASQFTDPGDADLLVSELTAFLLKYPLSDNSRTYIRNNFLLNNGTDVNVWRNAWTSNNLGVTVPALKNMIRFVMNLPEYHLC